MKKDLRMFPRSILGNWLQAIRKILLQIQLRIPWNPHKELSSPKHSTNLQIYARGCNFYRRSARDICIYPPKCPKCSDGKMAIRIFFAREMLIVQRILIYLIIWAFALSPGTYPSHIPPRPSLRPTKTETKSPCRFGQPFDGCNITK